MFSFPIFSDYDAQALIEKVRNLIEGTFGLEILIEESKLAANLIVRHPNITKNLLETVENVLVHRILHNLDEDEVCLLINLVSEIVIIAGKALESKILSFLEVFLKYSNHFNEKIKDKGIIGLKIVASVCPNDYFNSYVKKIIIQLDKVIQNTHKHNHRYFFKAKSSAIVCIGIILKFHSESLDFQTVFSWWVGLMQTSFEKEKKKQALCIFEEIIRENHFLLKDLDENTIENIKKLITRKENCAS